MASSLKAAEAVKAWFRIPGQRKPRVSAAQQTVHSGRRPAGRLGGRRGYRPETRCLPGGQPSGSQTAYRRDAAVLRGYETEEIARITGAPIEHRQILPSVYGASRLQWRSGHCEVLLTYSASVKGGNGMKSCILPGRSMTPLHRRTNSRKRCGDAVRSTYPAARMWPAGR